MNGASNAAQGFLCSDHATLLALHAQRLEAIEAEQKRQNERIERQNERIEREAEKQTAQLDSLKRWMMTLLATGLGSLLLQILLKK